MNLYKTNYIDDAQPVGRNECATWVGTQSDAAKTRKQLKADGMRDIETVDTDVLTDKAGLLTFLNMWCAVR